MGYIRNFLLFFSILSVPVFVQSKELVADTTKQGGERFLRQQIFPASLIGASLAIQALDLKERIQDQFPDTDTRTEDYLKFVPGVQLYVFDLAGMKHRNSVFDQTKYLLISQALTAFLVDVLKKSVQMERPNGGTHSFPSRHTSQAFSEATVLWLEFREGHPGWAFSGYLFASATGMLRITNDKHWLPDVLAGAGIGMLMTHLVYQIEPLKNWQPFKQERGISFVPSVTSNGAALTITF